MRLFLLLTLACGPLVYAQSTNTETGTTTEAEPEVDPAYIDEVQALAELADVQSAFAFILDQRDRTRADHITLTEIPAPPFKEERRAEAFADMLRASGADSVWIDDEGNVLALRRGQSGDRTVVLNAHIDTVFPEETDVEVKMSGDTLRAPGISDDTRGLALLLSVLRAMEETELETEANILFVGTVGEEGLGDLRGVKHLFREGGPSIDAFIAVDGAGMERVVHRGLGSHRYRVTFHGPGGHSWGAFGLANPIHAQGLAIGHFVAAADEYTRAEGPKTSYNVGRIGGGTSVNSIPFDSWIEVDMRSESPERLNEIDALFQEAMQRALREANDLRRDGPALTIEIDMIGNRPSGELSSSLPLVQRTLAATRYFDAQPQLGIGSTDSNTPIALGIPAVTIGHGGISRGAHSLSEWWIDQESYLAEQRALLLLLAEAGQAEDSSE